MLKKKIWANFQRIIELFTQKIVTKLSKYGFGIRDPEKTYSGSRIRGQKGTGSRIPDPDPKHWVKEMSSILADHSSLVYEPKCGGGG